MFGSKQYAGHADVFGCASAPLALAFDAVSNWCTDFVPR
jgi:hypothetical protein